MKRIYLLLVIALFFVGQDSVKAQFQIGLNSFNPILFGDLTKTELNNPGAGYVIYGTGGNIELMYHFKNKLGVGFRSNYSIYTKDIDAYKLDLMSAIGVDENNFMMQSVYAYHSLSGQFSVSYDISAGEKFSIEPYIYLGFNVFTSPIEEAVYFKNGSTFTRKKPVEAFGGFNYSPGVKFQWVLLQKHLGLVLYAEYDGSSIENWSEEYITYSSDSFTKSYVEKSYSIQSVNIGIGAYWRFGKSDK